MTISVHKAVALPKDSPMSADALPAGFPFLVIDERLEIVEPVLLYLIKTQLRKGKRHWKQHTANAMAFDLRDWFDYLAHCEWVNPTTKKLDVGKPWDIADESDFISWRDTMQEVISPQTNRELASRTIARRQGYVEGFYAHAQKQGWYVGEFLRSKVKKGRFGRSAIKDETIKHRKSALSDGTVSEYREALEFGEPVRPISQDEWLRIQQQLGPLPSESGRDSRPSRNRLASELAIGTGMRVDEIASLPKYKVRELYDVWLAAHKDQRIDGFFSLHITKTKRLKPRDVFVPGYLIPELFTYITHERESAIRVSEARAHPNGKEYKQPTQLFVNSAASAQHAGNPVRATSLSWAFKQACIAAGVTHLVEKIDIETNERYLESVCRHRFHDLRHTYAMWRNLLLKEQGETDPWKIIQLELGHGSVATTRDIYLKVIDVDRRESGVVQYNAKQSMGVPYA